MDWFDLTALELGAKIQAGEVSAVDAARACLARIEEKEPTVHAFVTVTPEAALARLSVLPLTRDPEGLLRQRPVAIAERALHNQGVAPVAHLITNAAQLARHAKTELFMNCNRRGVTVAVADNGQHLSPRSLFAFLY